MNIYQVHETRGCEETYYDSIVGTYLTLEKALEEKKKFEYVVNCAAELQEEYCNERCCWARIEERCSNYKAGKYDICIYAFIHDDTSYYIKTELVTE